MFSEFIGKKVRYVTIDNGDETTISGNTLVSSDGALIKLKDSLGNEVIVNTGTSNFIKLEKEKEEVQESDKYSKGSRDIEESFSDRYNNWSNGDFDPGWD